MPKKDQENMDISYAALLRDQNILQAAGKSALDRLPDNINLWSQRKAIESIFAAAIARQCARIVRAAKVPPKVYQAIEEHKVERKKNAPNLHKN